MIGIIQIFLSSFPLQPLITVPISQVESMQAAASLAATPWITVSSAMLYSRYCKVYRECTVLVYRCTASIIKCEGSVQFYIFVYIRHCKECSSGIKLYIRLCKVYRESRVLVYSCIFVLYSTSLSGAVRKWKWTWELIISHALHTHYTQHMTNTTYCIQHTQCMYYEHNSQHILHTAHFASSPKILAR